MQTNGFQNAMRVQTSLLSGVEKRALIWMAERMPSFINSDHLTLVGLLAMLGAGAGYWLSGGNTAWLWVVNGMILLNWAGDSLDGTLARVRNRQRPRYGFYVDHVIDAVSAVLLLGGLALSGYMSATVAVGLLVAFLLLAVESYLATYTLGTFHLSHGLFSPTELRLLLMIGNVALFVRTEATILDGRYLLFDVGGVIGVAGMLLLFAWAAIRNTTALYCQERLS
jgi:archaetidylinositol phosphate synthase